MVARPVPERPPDALDSPSPPKLVADLAPLPQSHLLRATSDVRRRFRHTPTRLGASAPAVVVPPRLHGRTVPRLVLLTALASRHLRPAAPSGTSLPMWSAWPSTWLGLLLVLASAGSTLAKPLNVSLTDCHSSGSSSSSAARITFSEGFAQLVDNVNGVLGPSGQTGNKLLRMNLVGTTSAVRPALPLGDDHTRPEIRRLTLPSSPALSSPPGPRGVRQHDEQARCVVLREELLERSRLTSDGACLPPLQPPCSR